MTLDRVLSLVSLAAVFIIGMGAGDVLLPSNASLPPIPPAAAGDLAQCEADREQLARAGIVDRLLDLAEGEAMSARIVAEAARGER